MKKQKDGKNKFFTLNHEVQVVTDVSQVIIHNCRGIIKLFLYLSTMFHNITRKLIRNFQWLKNQNKKSVPSKKNKSSMILYPDSNKYNWYIWHLFNNDILNLHANLIFWIKI